MPTQSISISILCALASTLALSSTLAACGAPDSDIQGTWEGKTTACQDAAHDGTVVFIPVLDTRTASVMTTLGVDSDDNDDSDEAVACTGSTAQLDEASDDLRFDVTRVCGDDDELAFALDLRSDGFGTAQSGTLTVTLGAATFASCDLTVTR